MDKAVQYDAIAQLDYRGWCRYQFFRDYEGAIHDIELLDSLVNYDIGFSQNGDYHLHIARALCYKGVGNYRKAIEIIENQLQDKNHQAGIYDYLHLGVLYLEMNQFDKTISNLVLQENENDIAENRYYLALAHKAKGEIEDYGKNLSLAWKKYEVENRMFDVYTDPMDKVYLEDIEYEIEQGFEQGLINIHK